MSPATSAVDATLPLAQGLLGADLVLTFVWLDDRTADVQHARPALAEAGTLSLFRPAVVAAGGALLERERPRRLISSALLAQLPAPVRGALVVADAAPDGVPLGGLLAVWTGESRVPDAVPPRLDDLREALALALRPAAQQVAAQRIAARFDAVMATVPQGVVFVDESTGAGLVNAAAAATLGVPVGEVGAHTLAASMAALRGAASNAGELDARARHLVQTPEARVENWLWTYTAPAPRAFRVTTVPVRSGPVAGRLWTFDDVTAEREAEAFKDQLIGTASHELRTPLTSIRGSLALIEGGVAGPMPEAALALVRIARTNAERLVRLVNDLLDLEKLGAGASELDLRPLDTGELVTAAADGVGGMAATARVRVLASTASRRAVSGDRDRLLQVLTNLLSNALKFSPPDADVTLTATDGADGDYVRFSVEDRGPGVPAEKVGRLFQRFQQFGVTHATRRGGTGLGLAITKGIVEQHGGRVGVESEPGVRTVFWCDVPAALEGAA